MAPDEVTKTDGVLDLWTVVPESYHLEMVYPAIHCIAEYRSVRNDLAGVAGEMALGWIAKCIAEMAAS